jgi:hypothetical protein
MRLLGMRPLAWAAMAFIAGGGILVSHAALQSASSDGHQLQGQVVIGGGLSDTSIAILELHSGKGSYEVFYLVHAVRKGFEDHQPVISEAEFRRSYGSSVQRYVKP